jgi:hypothetical protein
MAVSYDVIFLKNDDKIDAVAQLSIGTSDWDTKVTHF